MRRQLPGKPPPCRQICNASVRLWSSSASEFWMSALPIHTDAPLSTRLSRTSKSGSIRFRDRDYYSLLFAIEEEGICLIDRRHQHSGDIDVGGPGCRPDNRIGHIRGSERNDPLINPGGAFGISMEAHQAEVGFHHAG